MFQLAVNRKQLDENPLQHIAMPKVTKKKVEKYTADETNRIVRAAKDSQTALKWDMLIITALCTGMRRSELLNCTWPDIDFEDMTIEVSPKKSTDYTWEWLIKDTDRRELPLTKNVLQMLADHQNQQPEGYPYVFVPPARYDHIQQLRKQDKWTLKDSRLKVINNFSRKFEKILKMAGVRKRKFHCLRNTALTNWLVSSAVYFSTFFFVTFGMAICCNGFSSSCFLFTASWNILLRWLSFFVTVAGLFPLSSPFWRNSSPCVSVIRW